jgi:hypothetical protein
MHDNRKVHHLIELGQVISKDVEADSLIFEISNPWLKGRVRFLELVPGSDVFEEGAERNYTLPKPNLILPRPDERYVLPELDSVVFMYTASESCVAVGIVCNGHNRAKGFASRMGDIGFHDPMGADMPFPRTNDFGLPGSLIWDDKGRPLAIFHVFRRSLRYTHHSETTFGVPLISIVAKHTLLGGNSKSQLVHHLKHQTNPM